uniref:Uncharacterized protein n=1 Tax=Arundo donax TaxID=35708 RepID=A0A0A9ED49_ARUDO
MAREACHSLSQINQWYNSQGSSIATQKHLHLPVLISSKLTRALHSRQPWMPEPARCRGLLLISRRQPPSILLPLP